MCSRFVLSLYIALSSRLDCWFWARKGIASEKVSAYCHAKYEKLTLETVPVGDKLALLGGYQVLRTLWLCEGWINLGFELVIGDLESSMDEEQDTVFLGWSFEFQF